MAASCKVFTEKNLTSDYSRMEGISVDFPTFCTNNVRSCSILWKSLKSVSNDTADNGGADAILFACIRIYLAFGHSFLLNGAKGDQNAWDERGVTGNTCTQCGTIDNKRRSIAQRVPHARCARKIAQRLSSFPSPVLSPLNNPLSPPSHRDSGTKSITPMNAAGTTHRGRNAMEPRNPLVVSWN